MRRTFISGDVLLLRIPAIMRDLTSLLTMSMNQDQMPLNLSEDTPVDPLSQLAHPIQVVDLFAGPGGLGEGVTSYGNGECFQIVVSAEKDEKARQTLRLRAFYRLLKKHRQDCLHEYYDYCNDPTKIEFTPSEETLPLWEEAAREARCIELGSPEGNQELDDALSDPVTGLDEKRPWVLIGGPPCQAYSVVGRARNQAKVDYKAEEDHRHFLYKEYLRIIREKQPTVFVMENVKGILSSKINGELIFSSILKDLSNPHKALHEGGEGKRYHIYSLVTGAHFGPDDEVSKIDPRDFIIRAEKYGIPQARHRVILLGIAEDSIPAELQHVMLEGHGQRITVGQVLDDLPKLRSGLTKMQDSRDNWASVIDNDVLSHLRTLIGLPMEMWHELGKIKSEFKAPENAGGRRVRRAEAITDGATGVEFLDKWYLDRNLKYWLNHEARGHMESDLRRYMFAAVYARLHGFSPKGHKGFNLEGLAPNHKNWETGVFSDRFRVQAKDQPATTITSHISKDGHYFIHYDPAQCRSLSVREAARIQTFPDNYFFQGNRTEQFHQVGNAVPPLLAYKIAHVVFRILAGKVQAFDEAKAAAMKDSTEACALAE